MAYLIFKNNSDNIENTLCSIAENQNDLSHLDTIQTKVIEISNEQFLQIQLGNTIAEKYDGDIVAYKQTNPLTPTKEVLQSDINSLISQFNKKLSSNPNSYFKDRVTNYVNLIKNYNLDNITYPLNITFEQYLYNNNQTVLNTLQIQ